MILLLTRFEGVVYCAHHLGWAFEPESGRGAAIHGGRFNRPGMKSLHTSLRFETAWLEPQQGFAFKAQPMTLCSYRIDCEDILDLTDDAGCDGVAISTEELGCAWEALAADRKPVSLWALADRLFAAKYTGIIVPSFASRATLRDGNLVLWRWSRNKSYQIMVTDDDEKLPRDRSSRD